MNLKQIERLKALVVGMHDTAMANNLTQSLKAETEKVKDKHAHWKIRRSGESFQAFQNRISEVQARQLVSRLACRQERIRELFSLACRQDLEAMERYDQDWVAWSKGAMKQEPERPDWESTVWKVLSADPQLKKELTEIINRDGSRSHHRDAFPSHRFDAVETLLKEAGIQIGDETPRILSQTSEEPGPNSTGELIALKLGVDSSYVPTGKAQYNERASELKYRSQNRKASNVACLPWQERSNANRIVKGIGPSGFSRTFASDPKDAFGGQLSTWDSVYSGSEDKLVYLRGVPVLRRVTTHLRTGFLCSFSRTFEVKRYYMQANDDKGKPTNKMELVKVKRTRETIVPIPCPWRDKTWQAINTEMRRRRSAEFNESPSHTSAIVPDAIQRPALSIYTPTEADSVLTRFQRKSPWDYVSTYDPRIPKIGQQARYSESNNASGSIKVDNIVPSPCTHRNTTPISFDRSYRSYRFNGGGHCITFAAFGRTVIQRYA